MKNKQHDYSRIKYQLNSKRAKGQPSVIWSLRRDQVEYVENVLGYKTSPYIFRITTKELQPTSRTNSLLREIHYAKKDGITRVFKKLSAKDQKLLKEYGIYYTPLKFKIILIPS